MQTSLPVSFFSTGGQQRIFVMTLFSDKSFCSKIFSLDIVLKSRKLYATDFIFEVFGLRARPEKSEIASFCHTHTKTSQPLEHLREFSCPVRRVPSLAPLGTLYFGLKETGPADVRYRAPQVQADSRLSESNNLGTQKF